MTAPDPLGASGWRPAAARQTPSPVPAVSSSRPAAPSRPAEERSVPEREEASAARPAEPGDETPSRPVPNASVLSRTTDLINEILEESHRRLKFNVHQDTGRIWVQVIDTATNEVVKEIPPERYLDLVARIWELVGILVDERA